MVCHVYALSEPRSGQVVGGGGPSSPTPLPPSDPILVQPPARIEMSNLMPEKRRFSLRPVLRSPHRQWCLIDD